jgi:YggT family protein
MGAALYSITETLLAIYSYVLLARVLMSWLPDMERTPVGNIILRMTEPYLAPFRRFIPPLPLGSIYLDVSFIVAWVVYSVFFERGVLYLLHLAITAFQG